MAGLMDKYSRVSTETSSNSKVLTAFAAVLAATGSDSSEDEDTATPRGGRRDVE